MLMRKCQNAFKSWKLLRLVFPQTSPPLVLKMPTISACQKLGGSPITPITVNFLIQKPGDSPRRDTREL
jgi:hypothetical protein